jgi:hypothetical protein
VTAFRTAPDGSVNRALITTTREAYDTLIEARAPVDNPAWSAALDAIVRSLLDPTPEKVEAGRVALDRLYNPPVPS